MELGGEDEIEKKREGMLHHTVFISRNIGKHNIWWFAQKTLLAVF